MNKRWRTIVVDPPWPYRQKFTDPGALWSKKRKKGKGAAANYPSMTMAQLRDLPIGEWAEPDAHLYLWVTNQFLEEGLALAQEWGFVQKTLLTWVKKGLRMGFYFRNNTEHVIFAVRGRLRTRQRNEGTWFQGNIPARRHSAKPESFYDLVERMSPGPYLDVFARRHRLNWECYGNEVYSAIEAT